MFRAILIIISILFVFMCVFSGFGLYKIYELLPLTYFFVILVVFFSLIIAEIFMIRDFVNSVKSNLDKAKDKLKEESVKLKKYIQTIITKLNRIPKSIWKIIFGIFKK